MSRQLLSSFLKSKHQPRGNHVLFNRLTGSIFRHGVALEDHKEMRRGTHIYSRDHDTNKPPISINGQTASEGKIHFFVLSTGISQLVSGVQEGRDYRCGS